MLVCLHIRARAHARVENVCRGRLTRGNHRRSIPLSSLPDGTTFEPRALTAQPGAAKLLAVRRNRRPRASMTKQAPLVPRTVLLSDFHKADQRPSVVKKRAYVRTTVVLRSWESLPLSRRRRRRRRSYLPRLNTRVHHCRRWKLPPCLLATMDTPYINCLHSSAWRVPRTARFKNVCGAPRVICCYLLLSAFRCCRRVC